MALALDGNAAPTNGSTSSQTVTLTTSSHPDLVFMVGLTNGGPFTTVTSPNVTWTNYETASAVSSSQTLEIWYGVASSALSSEVITVNNTSAAFTTLTAFGVSGADTSTKWDADGGFTQSNSSTTLTINTANANDFIVAAYRFGSTGSPTQGSGWTLLQGTNFLLVEYQIVSSTQAGLVATIGTGSGDNLAGASASIIQLATGGASSLILGVPKRRFLRR